MQKRCIVLAFLLLFSAAGLLAAGPVPLTAVKIPVRVTDTKGSPLQITQDNLRLTQEKGPITPTAFLGTESPVLIIVVFDTTGDMTYIDAVRKELVKFVEVLPPSVQMSVMTANDGLKVVQKPTADKDLLGKAILNYPTKGYPGFLENIVSVTDFTDKYLLKFPIRVSVLFITDSDIYKCRKQYTSADLTTEAQRDRELLQETFTPVFVLRLPTGNTDTMSRTYEGTIRDISRATCGETEFIMSPTGVSPSLATSLFRIHETAFVGYDPADIKPNKEYKLNVELTGLPTTTAKVEFKSSFRIRK